MSIGINRDRSPLAPLPDDWLLDGEEIDQLEEMLKTAEIDTEHDIPYTAGYSEDAKTVYFDKEVPHYLEIKARGKKLDTVKIDLYKSFGTHERIEKSLEEGPPPIDYELAHQAALAMERLYVESIGGDWNDYNDKTLELVNSIYKRSEFSNVPDDLDLEPYRDEEDTKTLKKMGKDETDKDVD